MKKSLTALLILLMLVGCHAPVEEGQGYVLEANESRVLVIDELHPGQSWQEIMEDYQGSAIWLTTKKSRHLEPGQKIRYKIKGGIEHSYPAHASANAVKVIEEAPKSSKL
ncbi:hypothetical protein JCM10914A_51190 [Paenibacillus sp. JCM 10914]|uniref:YobA family protein n=1 Tax=Paenibacillus sp. JCM 10914 TaxID=1236974 RepID=UPI0003CCB62E|nr:YobA family protein [Paenibacillus sp. JCM 10914]GAE05183.1 hypothetical protein JCM10914_1274 [Paenibacillus sp. JCM 10914]